MKKFAILFAMILGLVAFNVTAQDAVVSRNGTNFEVPLDAGDTVLNTNTLYKTIGVGAKQAIQLYSIQVTMDSVSGTPAHTIYLKGSMDNSNYFNIDTVSWAGSSADTTFHFTDVSTGIAWPYVRVHVAGAADSKSKMTDLAGRFFDKVR